MSAFLQLLEIIESNKYVETYRYFPDVFLCGKQFLDEQEISMLIEKEFLNAVKHDSFGTFLQLSEKAKKVLQEERNSVEASMG